MSQLDGIHVMLWHIPYSSGSYRVCLFVQTVLIKRMTLVMTFLGFHHILLDSILGHIPYVSRPSRGGWFVQTVLIEDISLVMTFLDFIMFILNVILGHTP